MTLTGSTYINVLLEEHVRKQLPFCYDDWKEDHAAMAAHFLQTKCEAAKRRFKGGDFLKIELPMALLRLVEARSPEVRSISTYTSEAPERFLISTVAIHSYKIRSYAMPSNGTQDAQNKPAWRDLGHTHLAHVPAYVMMMIVIVQIHYLTCRLWPSGVRTRTAWTTRSGYQSGCHSPVGAHSWTSQVSCAGCTDGIRWAV